MLEVVDKLALAVVLLMQWLMMREQRKSRDSVRALDETVSSLRPTKRSGGPYCSRCGVEVVKIGRIMTCACENGPSGMTDYSRWDDVTPKD